MVFKGLNTMQISVGKYMPTRGGSYIQLPKFISAKRACINIKNENDDNCFKYSVQCGYYKIYEKNALRTSKSLQEDRGHIKLGRGGLSNR